MMGENRTPPLDTLSTAGMQRTNSSKDNAMPIIRSHSSASVVSGILDEGGLVANGTDHGGEGIRKNTLSIGHIVTERPST